MALIAGLPLAGRERELSELMQLLAAPDTRLVTLVGPGGVGKTRLAEAVAERQRAHGEAPVVIVALQALETPERLVPALAEGLGVPLTGTGTPEQQLAQHLSQRALLLVLDNFEQLLPDGAPVLEALLQSAPGLRLLVTSQVVLRLPGEWVYAVDGLRVPPGPLAPAEALAYGAVELFTAWARRRRAFDLARECAGVIEICQLVEGLPLALEMAAAWVAALPAAEIAAALRGRLAQLADARPGRPARQASLHAVFAYAWGRLTAAEQHAYSRLAVFRGGFETAAAAAVAQAPVDVLAGLTDKSLVRAEASGRLHLHDWLRQLAQAQLTLEGEAAVAEMAGRHLAYFAAFSAARLEELHGSAQAAALRALSAESDNLRAAWAYAVARGDGAALGRLADAAYYLWQMRSRYLEGVAAIEAALQTITPAADPALVARLLDYAGWLHLRLGRLDQARAALTRSQALFAEHALAIPATFGGDPRTALGVLALVSGDYAAAAGHGAAALAAAEARGDGWNAMFARYVLANTAAARGDYATAREYAERAHAHAAAAQEQWFRAFLLNDLGTITRAQGDLALAQSYYHEAYTLREVFGDPGGMAVTLLHLGELALEQARPGLAHTHFEHGLELYRGLGDLGGLGEAHHGLARVALAEGRRAAAGHHLHEALRLALSIQFVPLTLAVAVSAAEWLMAGGPSAAAVSWLSALTGWPSVVGDVRRRAQSLLTMAEAQLPPARLTAARAWAAGVEVPALGAAVLARLAAGDGAQPESVAAEPEPPLAAALTPRELQVLGLLAEGASNKAIAAALHLELGTVKWYTGQIYAKLHSANRTQALNQARALGLLR